MNRDGGEIYEYSSRVQKRWEELTSAQLQEKDLTIQANKNAEK